MRCLMVVAAVCCLGCSSVHVGAGIPVPGPIKPTVGVSVDKSGVKGHGGVSGTVGKVPVHVSGSTKAIKPKSERTTSKSK